MLRRGVWRQVAAGGRKQHKNCMELQGKRWDNERALAKVRGKKIRSLDLFNSSVDDVFLAEVASTGSLKSLHVSSDVITDDGIIAVVENCSVSSLLLSGVPKVTDRSLESIAQCATIGELYLEGTCDNRSVACAASPITRTQFIGDR